MTAAMTTPDRLRLAFALILTWPCPDCGRPFPCPCDGLPADDPADDQPKAQAGAPQAGQGGAQ